MSFPEALASMAPPPPIGMEGAPGGIGQPPDIPSPRGARIRARVRPYRLPEPAKRPKPKADDILEMREQRMRYWKDRDDRMDADLNLYLLADAPDGPIDGEEKIRRVTARATVDKMSYMVGRQHDKVRVKARAPGSDYREAAQNIEDFLYAVREAAAERHSRSLRTSLGRDEAWHGSCQGYIAARCFLAPEEDLPVSFELFNPRHVYPQPGGTWPGQMHSVIYHEKQSLAEFLGGNAWAQGHRLLKDLEPQDKVDITWYEDDCWSVVLVDDKALRTERHHYGFCPWIVTAVAGPPIRNEATIGHFGSGVITPLRHTFGVVDRLLSAVATDVARMGNPPIMSTFDSTTGASKPPAKPSLKPGARNAVDRGRGEGHEIMAYSRDPNAVTALIQATTEDIQRQGLVGVLWGNAEGMSSGFHQAVANNAAEDALFPVTDAIITHRQMVNQMLLNLVLVADRLGLIQPDAAEEEEGGEYGLPIAGVSFRRRNRQPGANSMTGRVMSGESYDFGVLTPEDIEMNGVRNEVLLRRMTPQDLMAMVQAGAMAIQSNLLSMNWVREHWLDVDDPDAMNMEIIYEMVAFKDEEFMKEYWRPMVLRLLDPELFAFWQRRQEEQAMMAQMAPPGPPPGPPPGGMPLPGMIEPGGPPQPGVPGVPSQFLPPDLQAQPQPGAGDPAAVEAYLASLAQQGLLGA